MILGRTRARVFFRGFLRRFSLPVLPARVRWRCFCDPDSVPAPAVVFFPHRPNVICCGIIGVIAVKGQDIGDTASIIAALGDGLGRLHAAVAAGNLGEKDAGTGVVAATLAALKAEGHIARIVASLPLQAELQQHVARLETLLTLAQERRSQLEHGTVLEKANAELLLLEDALWTLKRDMVGSIAPIERLAGGEASPLTLERLARINLVLNGIDRLEVRGRDSAGIEVDFSFNADVFQEIMGDVSQRGLLAEFAARSQPGDARDGSISVAKNGVGSRRQVGVTFAYKTFSIVGKLGKNVRYLRERIGNDAILRRFIGFPASNEAVFSHTRWASVGAISEGNCHPINNHTVAGSNKYHLSVALNGDIDNYASLKTELEARGFLAAPDISTDTKIIPLMVDRFISEGKNLEEAFRLALCSFEGSHAIVMRSSLAPEKVFLAQKGSGQTLYVGLGPQGYVFSSELYGVVEATPNFIRLNGETKSPGGNSGQIVVLDQDGAGGLSGISAHFYDGEQLVLAEADVCQAEITTRDIDRGSYPHHFLKEIMESPRSVANTLMGKYRLLTTATGQRLEFNIGEEVLPAGVVARLSRGEIRDIFVIGHGTAGIAANAVAAAIARYFRGSGIRVTAKVASELSGFHLEQDFSRVLVIPVTQSGTTTDTNRAVAMVKERGATIISIVNRRQSDITVKSDGVFYTSSGRDVEMSVASTKAFYSQIIAGHILALALAVGAGKISSGAAASEMAALEGVVPAMREMLATKRDAIKDAARLAVSGARHWAIVGSGPNKIAADEIRIKLSELCYKTISTDIIEDKKHIDLSAEPLIIVCAAGTPPSVLEDVIKDTAIFKAHRAKVIVFAEEGETRFDETAASVIPIAHADYPGSIILNTIAGHLWGYYAACFIDAEAQFFRGFRSEVNALMSHYAASGLNVYEQLGDYDLRNLSESFSRDVRQRLAVGAFSAADNKALGELLILLKYTAGKLPADDFWEEFGPGPGGEVSPLTALDATLKKMVESLSRPVDAIRHQAKTVTVGTSRKETALRGTIFDLVTELGFSFKDISSRNALAIMRVQPVVAAIKGFTLYSVAGLDKDSLPQEGTTVTIEKRSGVSLQRVSRAEKSSELLGMKNTIVRKRDIYIGQGKLDGAPIIVFPLRCVGNATREYLLLIHVSFRDDLTWEVKKRSLGTRYSDIRNLIAEYNIGWSDDYVKNLPLSRLLGEQAEVIALEIKNAVGSGGA